MYLHNQLIKQLIDHQLGQDIDRTLMGIVLCLRPANERRRYNVTSSLIGWAHARNDPCIDRTSDVLQVL